jgi:hypothetical protein
MLAVVGAPADELSLTWRPLGPAEAIAERIAAYEQEPRGIEVVKGDGWIRTLPSNTFQRRFRLSISITRQCWWELVPKLDPNDEGNSNPG